MPELPEVRTVARYLNEKLANEQINKITVRVPKMIKEITVSDFQSQLLKMAIEKVTNHGKFLLFWFKNSDLIMLSHLRMEGKYHLEPWEHDKHDHVVFELANKKLYYNDTRKFGTFHLKTKQNYLTTLPLSKMGPEPGGASATTIYQKMQKKRIAIKTALLDQTLLSGIGNIYVDEVLWTEKIHPLTSAYMINLTQVKSILKTAQKIMDQSTAMGGTTIRSYMALDQKEGNFQNFLKVHTKAGTPCPRCHTTIKKIKVNGRGTYYCPKEQKN